MKAMRRLLRLGLVSCCLAATSFAAEWLPIEQQVATLWAMQKGYYDALELKRVTAAAVSIREFFTTRKDALLTKIRTKAALDADLETELKSAADEWKGTFA